MRCALALPAVLLGLWWAGPAFAQPAPDTPASEETEAPSAEAPPATEAEAPVAAEAPQAPAAEAPNEAAPPARESAAEAAREAEGAEEPIPEMDVTGAELSRELSAEERASLGLPPESPEPGGASTGGELSAAELAELGLTAADVGEKSVFVGAPLEFSGFADFTFISLAVPKDSPWRGAINRYPTFAIGNFNLYMSKDLTRYLRTFAEVRFTVLPNGAPITGSPTGEFVSTITPDYADFGRPMKWAGIEIERLYLEWTAHQLLTFRLGMFLTPYGIWNVDHGTPTIIPVTRPFIIGQELFPERQTGLEIYGSKGFGEHHTLGYHATLSNGQGPIQEYDDLDRNKAVGGRLFYRNVRLGTLQLGGSAYYGQDTWANEAPSLDANGDVVYREVILQQSNVLSLAADARWEWNGLLLQSELITQQRVYTERGRKGGPNPVTGEYLFPVDRLSWGVYGLAGYRFDWYGVMPYVMYQHISTVTAANLQLILCNAFNVGLNIRPIPVLTAKVDYLEGYWPRGFALSDDPIRMVQVQFAWAF